MLPLKEIDIYDAYKRAAERLSGDLGEATQAVKDNIESELSANLSQSVSDCKKEIAKKQQEVLELFQRKRDGIISSNEYDAKYQKLSEKLIELQNQQAKLQKENFAAQLTRQRLKDITELLSDNKIEIVDENMMKNLLENIKVIGKHEIEIQFKCGLSAIERIKDKNI